MTNTKMLVGSLSNDLFRVASLAHRNSDRAAARFLREAKRWSNQLKKRSTAKYIKKIAENVSLREDHDISEESAEQYLMYGVLLQNYCLHSS